MVEEIAAPFDEDRIIERIDQDHRGRGPKGWRRPDQRIAEDVNEQLTDAPDVDASDIDVLVRDAEVTLDGTVETRAERRRVEEVAEEIRGVIFVQNRLRVRGRGLAEAGRTRAPTTAGGQSGVLPTGAGSDASATSDSGPTGLTAGTGASVGSDPLLGSDESGGRRYASAPVDEGVRS